MTAAEPADREIRATDVAVDEVEENLNFVGGYHNKGFCLIDNRPDVETG